MCGFFGMVGQRFGDSFGAALRCLQSRGPDDEGIWTDGDVRLGHRRLSVIDLAGGHQPMATADGRYHVIFNGEIYNFPELRRDLEATGRSFRTHSDTEVLLEGFAAWGGVKLLERLDGMFAFVIWDRAERKLFAARDRFGIKPLFYSTIDGVQIGSTLAPWWKLREFPRRLDVQALREYLATQVIPAPMSILRDVRTLAPGCYLEWDEATRRLTTARYWDIPPATGQAMTLDALTEASDEAIARSVRRQMIADVPLGAFLSGGIDSSLMVHYMSRVASPVKTFTVRFPQDKRYDESDAAASVARHYGCDHHVLDAQEIGPEQLQHAIAALDQPFADPAYLPTLGLAHLTRRHVTVAISGDGGDELFGGYERFLRGEDCYPATAAAALRGVVERGLLPPGLMRRTLHGRQRLLWERVKLGPWRRSRKSFHTLLTPAALSSARVDETMRHWIELASRFSGRMDTDGLMRADLWTYLCDDCLTKTDRASMDCSLEVRVPLLGNDVVDLVLPQPASVKLSGGLKCVLTTLARRHLPEAVWNRPKHGFSVPLEHYMRGPWRQRCTQWVERVETLAPFLRADGVRRLWAQTLNGRGEARLMYTLLVLLGWLQTHPIDSAD